MTIAVLADKSMADYVRPKLKPRTVFDYERLLAQHILPALGHLLVARIDHDDVNRLHVGLKRIPRRANYTISTVRALMNFAEKLRLRPPATNPPRESSFIANAGWSGSCPSWKSPGLPKALLPPNDPARSDRTAPLGCGLRFSRGPGAAKSPPAMVVRRLAAQADRLPDSKTNEPRTIHLSDAALDVLRGLPRVGPDRGRGANEANPIKSGPRLDHCAQVRRAPGRPAARSAA